MKMYTNESQTAKLIELGLPKPKGSHSYWRGNELVINVNYSIGELIEMLGYDLYSMHYLGMSWQVKGEQVAVIKEELIDALYAMILQLKEEGVI